MRLSCEGWFVISHLWRWELVQTATVRLGIDTLIANILVFLIFITVARDSGRLLYFGRVIYLFFFILFSVHQIFDVPGPIFAKICHTMRYVLK